MDRIKMLFLSLFGLFSDNRGTVDPGDDESSDDGGEDEGEESSEEAEEGEESEGEGEDEDGDDSGEDSGNNDERSKYIPRKRFDKEVEKNKRIQNLIDQGILQENEDGELVVAKTNKETDDQAKTKQDYYFKEEDVDKESWPLVQKINTGFKKFDDLANRFAYTMIQLQAENAILRDYPEYLQKDSPLRKKTMELLKDDPEFKKKYKNDPERGYWAVKRASELLSGRKNPSPKKKPNSRFIVSKGDSGSGKTDLKKLDFSKLTQEQLDELERKEFEGAGSKR